MGHGGLPCPVSRLYSAPAPHLRPLPLRDGGRGQSDMRVLGHPAGSVRGSVSPEQTETSPALSAALVPSLARLAARFVPPSKRTGTSALLRHLPGAQLYPSLSRTNNLYIVYVHIPVTVLNLFLRQHRVNRAPAADRVSRRLLLPASLALYLH